MSFLACSSGVQHDFDDLPPSAVEESPGTPARFRSLRPVITSSGLVKYAALVEDPSLLLHNVAVVQDYSELDWGSKEDSPRNIAFYCNAYNIWAMYLVFKKMRKHGLAWHGECIAATLVSLALSTRNRNFCLLLHRYVLVQGQQLSKQEPVSFTLQILLLLDRRQHCSRYLKSLNLSMSLLINLRSILSQTAKRTDVCFKLFELQPFLTRPQLYLLHFASGVLQLEKYIYDKFSDPRICFAINCGCWGSPRLAKVSAHISSKVQHS